MNKAMTRERLKEIEATYRFPGVHTYPGELIAEIRRLQGELDKVPSWISVEDQLPDKPGYYLTYSLIGGIWASEYGMNRGKLEFRDSIGFPLWPYPTHWQPLPMEPGEEEQR